MRVAWGEDGAVRVARDTTGGGGISSGGGIRRPRRQRHAVPTHTVQPDPAASREIPLGAARFHTKDLPYLEHHTTVPEAS